MGEEYDLRSKRGYFGIGIHQPKFASNIGVLWRSAYNFGANHIFTVGKRYKYQRPDVTKAYKHIPLWEYESFEDMNIPKNCSLIGIEIDESAESLYDFFHPERAIYLLGSEDQGLSEDIIESCDSVVQIPSLYCLNVSTVGSIVMYDRKIKGENK